MHGTYCIQGAIPRRHTCPARGGPHQPAGAHAEGRTSCVANAAAMAPDYLHLCLLQGMLSSQMQVMIQADRAQMAGHVCMRIRRQMHGWLIERMARGCYVYAASTAKGSARS